MRDAALRKERATFINELSCILTNVDDDKNYFKRLLWANEWIAHRLLDFELDTTHEEGVNEK